MVKELSSNRSTRRAPRPLDEARLEELALAYVARFATTAHKLEGYLARKLRERGWDGESAPDSPALVARHVERGYVDDETFARMRTGSLLRRGYGPRRVSEALGMAGVAADLRENMAPDVLAQRQAALTLARKRRFGPFGAEVPDHARREKQIAAMMRAGHERHCALALIHAESVDAAERWVDEAQEI